MKAMISLRFHKDFPDDASSPISHQICSRPMGDKWGRQGNRSFFFIFGLDRKFLKDDNVNRDYEPNNKV